MDFTRSREIGERLRRAVPGGCHTYAKLSIADWALRMLYSMAG